MFSCDSNQFSDSYVPLSRRKMLKRVETHNTLKCVIIKRQCSNGSNHWSQALVAFGGERNITASDGERHEFSQPKRAAAYLKNISYPHAGQITDDWSKSHKPI